MGFFSRLSTIGNRTLARTIAEQFAKEFINAKNANPKKLKVDLIRETLGRMPNWQSAQSMLSTDFLDDEDNLDIPFLIYNMAIEESPINKRRLSIPANQIDAYTEEITNVLKEHGLHK